MLRRSISLIALLLGLALAAPASAAPQPQVTDPCGDAASHVQINNENPTLLEESRPSIDFRSGLLQGVYGPNGALQALSASVTLCGQPSTTDAGYSLGWHHADGCWTSLSWGMNGPEQTDSTGVHGAVKLGDPIAEMTETCPKQQQTPLDSSVQQMYRVVLAREAVAFSGNTVTFTVALGDLPAAAGKRFAPGTAWSQITGTAVERQLTLYAGYVYTDDERGTVRIRSDYASSGGSYIVGADRPVL